MDDIIIIGKHPHLITNLVQLMQKEFQVKDLGSLSFFLGIQVTRSPVGLHLCQAKYVTNLLNITKMAGVKPAKPPCLSDS